MNRVDLRNRQRTLEENMLIGSQIKHYRKQLRLTQKELGEQINRSAIAVRKYEKGDIEVPLEVLKNISVVLKVSLFELMFTEKLNSVSNDILLMVAKNNNISVSELINTNRTMYIDEVERGFELDRNLKDSPQKNGLFKIMQDIDECGVRTEYILPVEGSPDSPKDLIPAFASNADILYKFLRHYNLIPSVYSYKNLYAIETKLIPYLRFIINELSETEDK